MWFKCSDPPPFCGSTKLFPCFLVADLHQDFSVFNGSVVKIPLAQAKCIFFLIVQSMFCEHITCLYSVNDILPSSAVVQFHVFPQIKTTLLNSHSSCPWLNTSSSHFMLASHVSPVPPIPTICHNGIHENII